MIKFIRRIIAKFKRPKPDHKLARRLVAGMGITTDYRRPG
jgi:hypothetical protein